MLVVGDFIDRRNIVKKVDLGQPFSFQCPDHKPSFGTVYTWVGRKRIQFSRSKRRGISPNGGLYIVYLTQEDIDEIHERNGIKCKISGANSYRESGTLKLEKNNEEQSGKQCTYTAQGSLFSVLFTEFESPSLLSHRLEYYRAIGSGRVTIGRLRTLLMHDSQKLQLQTRSFPLSSMK